MYITIELIGNKWHWNASSNLDWLKEGVCKPSYSDGFQRVYEDEVTYSSWGDRKVWIIKECNYRSDVAREFCKFTREATFRHWNGDADSFTRVFNSQYNHMSDHVDLVFRCTLNDKDSLIRIMRTFDGEFPYQTESEYTSNFNMKVWRVAYGIAKRQEIVNEIQRQLNEAKKELEIIESIKIQPWESHRVIREVNLPSVSGKHYMDNYEEERHYF